MSRAFCGSKWLSSGFRKFRQFLELHFPKINCIIHMLVNRCQQSSKIFTQNFPLTAFLLFFPDLRNMDLGPGNARYAQKWHLFPGWEVPSPKWQCNVYGTIWWYQHNQFLCWRLRSNPFKIVQAFQRREITTDAIRHPTWQQKNGNRHPQWWWT